MKQFGLAILLSVASVLGVLTNFTSAESVLLNGQKHYYTVQLRDDKRALVYANLIFDNPSSKDEKAEYKFSLPEGVSVSDLTVQQVLAKTEIVIGDDSQNCAEYETYAQYFDRVGYNYGSNPQARYEREKMCLVKNAVSAYDVDYDYDKNMSGSSDYYYYSYYSSKPSTFEYADLEVTEKDGKYTVSLEEKVQPKKQGSILVSFIAKDYVQGGFLGRYTYDVRTLRTDQIIDKAVVSVNFDNNMYTREAEQKRGYESRSSSIGLSSSIADGVDSSTFSSGSMDDRVRSTGQGGVFVKEQESLLPGDVLSVTGVFATNKFMLFSTDVLITIACFALVVVGAVYFRKWWRKKHPVVVAKETKGEVAQATEIRDIRVISSWQKIAPSCILTSLISNLVAMLLFVGMLSLSSLTGASDLFFLSEIAVIGAVLVGPFVVIGIPLAFAVHRGLKASDAVYWSIAHLMAMIGAFIAVFIIMGMIAS